MLAKTWRLTAVNNTGASATISISGIGRGEDIYSFPTYAVSGISYLNGALGTSPNYLQGSTNFNSSYQYFGIDFLATLTFTSAPSGTVSFYYEISPDGGTTWPDPGNSYLLYTTPTINSSGTYNYSFSK